MNLLFRRRSRSAAGRDVERLLRQYGPEAYRIAGEMAWRQDAGLLSAPAEGHWHRVHCAIGEQTGQCGPRLDTIEALGAPTRSGPLRPTIVGKTMAPAVP